MENKQIRSVEYYMRLLHRNVGFFILGFALIYGLSGVILIFRDTNFLKHEKKITVFLPVETNSADIGTILKLREFKIIRTEGNISYFQGGKFNKLTGETEYSVKELLFPFNKLTALHKMPSKNAFHLVNLTFGILLIFLAISSIFMFKIRSAIFMKGLYIILAGFILAIIVIAFVK